MNDYKHPKMSFLNYTKLLKHQKKLLYMLTLPSIFCLYKKNYNYSLKK